MYKPYEPDAMGNQQPVFAVELAEVTRQRPLAIYAGAGLSQASPTDIPDGAEIARRCHAQLIDALRLDELACEDPSNLTSVSDAAAQKSSLELIRQIAVSVADFTSARPNFSHEILALLLLEGIVVVITTNWDDCIERAGGEERILAVISDQDRRQINRAALLLKVHGCATRPTTVLITTEDLATPPAWARDAVNVHLSNSHTVFVGIGDIADYARKRILEAKDAIGTEGTIFVVSPSIQTEWNKSHWAEILPDLPNERRVSVTSDEFLDHLAAACVRRMLREIFESLRDEPAVANAFDRTRKAFDERTSVEALRWLRCCCVPNSPGTSATKQQAFTRALIALGTLGKKDGVVLLPSGQARAADIKYEVLVAVDTVTASKFRREAEARLVRYRSEGGEVTHFPTFLIAGALGKLDSVQGLLTDVLDESDARDLVAGPLVVDANIVYAEDHIV